MSTMIPYDLLPAISNYFFTKQQQQQQQQQQCTQPSPAPTFLSLPRQLRLDCLMPVSVLPVPIPFPPPPMPLHSAAQPPSSSSSRRSAFSRSHPHHPALVIPPAALQADLTTDDPTPPPLVPGQVIPLPLALAPTQVPLPPSPVDTRSATADEPETKTNGLLSSHEELPPQRAPHHPGWNPGCSTEPPQEVLDAIKEAASSALPIPIPHHILPPSPPVLARQPPPFLRRPTTPFQPHTGGAIHCTHPNGYNDGKHVNGNGNGHGNVDVPPPAAKGRGGSVNPIFVKGTPTHPILNGVPSTPVPTCTEFATPPPPLPTYPNARRPIVVHGPLIGNLLLSSCPGKKVRLNGPVKGRGTIYRNLGLDLQRMKDVGVRCVVCCLDDTELQFLGAPWEEYAREASIVGLDILRIPTPEGFAPLAPGMLNDQLDFLIQKYTIQGQNILVHCRGGVGRAGLVACCWMLKVGLCGWIQEAPVNGHGNVHVMNGVSGVNQPQTPAKTTAEVFFHNVSGCAPAPPSDDHAAPPHPATTTTDDSRPPTRPGTPRLSVPSPAPPPPPIQWDTVELVERVVRVVRWRRSVKAIETYEQVRFLVEFVEFLRGRHVPTPDVEPMEDANANANVVVVNNGYPNGFLNGIKENGGMVDRDIHVAMKECGGPEVQGT